MLGWHEIVVATMNIQQSNISGPVTTDSPHLETELKTSGN